MLTNPDRGAYAMTETIYLYDRVDYLRGVTFDSRDVARAYARVIGRANRWVGTADEVYQRLGVCPEGDELTDDKLA